MWICRSNYGNDEIITCITDSIYKPTKNPVRFSWSSEGHWYRIKEDILPNIKDKCYQLSFNPISNVYFQLTQRYNTIYTIKYNNKVLFDRTKSFSELFIDLKNELSIFPPYIKLYIKELDEINLSKLTIF